MPNDYPKGTCSIICDTAITEFVNNSILSLSNSNSVLMIFCFKVQHYNNKIITTMPEYEIGYNSFRLLLQNINIEYQGIYS